MLDLPSAAPPPRPRPPPPHRLGGPAAAPRPPPAPPATGRGARQPGPRRRAARRPPARPPWREAPSRPVPAIARDDGGGAATRRPARTGPGRARSRRRTAPTNSGSEPEPAEPGGDGDEEVDLDIAPLLVAGVPAVLAAGIVLRLDRVRRRRSRRRPRRRARSPARRLQATERRWRAIADHESADWVDTALRYLTWAVRSTGAPVSVVGVRTGANGLELLLSTPARQGAPGSRPTSPAGSGG